MKRAIWRREEHASGTDLSISSRPPASRVHSGSSRKDLVDTHRRRTASVRADVSPWSFRLRTEMQSRYLGEDTREFRVRLDRAEALKADTEARRKRMTSLARILRAGEFITADRETGSMLFAFARAAAFPACRHGPARYWRCSPPDRSARAREAAAWETCGRIRTPRRAPPQPDD